MKKHVKVYMEHHGYTQGDFIPCSNCSAQATDIHHIKSRGMGGSKRLDVPDNLIALCRRCHNAAHGITERA
jgi:5-methylcytosine-specific restriction endonuclease McrA